MKINWDDLDAAPALNGNGIMHTNGSSNSNDQYEASSSGQPISARDPLNG